MGELFDHVLIIQLEVQDGKLKPRVGYQFPPAEGDKEGAEETGTVVQFCFPEEAIPQAKKASETFSFALTATDGSKRFGYCRRWLDGKNAECCCVISLVPSLSLFTRLLDIVEERRKISPTAVFSFLKTVLAHTFPDPGDSIVVRTFGASASGTPDEYTLTRPATETLADFVSLETALFHKLSVADIVELWQSLLFERRVLIVAGNLETLSQAVTALCALLHPFIWQHVFIPILPKSLVGYATAPMPFLIGCLHSSLSVIKDMGMPLEEIYLVDVDSGVILMRPTGLKDLLPRDQAASLRNSLVAAISSSTPKEERDKAIFRSFLKFFQSVLGDYSKFFTSQKPTANKRRRSTKVKYFDSEAFVKSVGPSCEPFIDAFQSSQLWFMFIQTREDMAARNELIDHCPILTPLPHPVPSKLLSDCGGGDRNICDGCGSKINSQNDPCSQWNGKLYHTKCFACCECNALLEGERRITETNEGKPHCVKCGGFTPSDDCSDESSSSSSIKTLRGMWGAMKKKLFKDQQQQQQQSEASNTESTTSTTEGGVEKPTGVRFFQFKARSIKKNIATQFATLRGRRHKRDEQQNTNSAESLSSSDDLSPPQSPDPSDESFSPRIQQHSATVITRPPQPPLNVTKKPGGSSTLPTEKPVIRNRAETKKHHRSISDPELSAVLEDGRIPMESTSVLKKCEMFDTSTTTSPTTAASPNPRQHSQQNTRQLPPSGSRQTRAFHPQQIQSQSQSHQRTREGSDPSSCVVSSLLVQGMSNTTSSGSNLRPSMSPRKTPQPPIPLSRPIASTNSSNNNPTTTNPLSVSNPIAKIPSSGQLPTPRRLPLPGNNNINNSSNNANMNASFSSSTPSAGRSRGRPLPSMPQQQRQQSSSSHLQ